MTFIFMVHLSFMQFHCKYMTSCMISLPHFRVPFIIISKVIDISCNGRRNVIRNYDIIHKLVDITKGFVCIRIVGGHSFL